MSCLLLCAPYLSVSPTDRDRAYLSLGPQPLDLGQTHSRRLVNVWGGKERELDCHSKLPAMSWGLRAHESGGKVGPGCW